MIPTNYRKLYKDLAETTGEDLQFIADCIDFYYADLRSTLTEMEILNISSPGLGTFSIKINSIKKNIYKCKNILNKKDTYTIKSYKYYKHKEFLLDRLIEVKSKYDIEKEEKLKFKKNVQLKRNLEE